MAYLLIRKVKYSGDRFIYESPTLSVGLNIIEGPNGTGKSTFMNLIYYGLGGDVPEFSSQNKRSQKHKEIVNDANNKVELIIEISEEIYSLTRLIGKNDIFVSASNAEESYVYPIHRRGDAPIFSDWLIDKLEIEIVEIYQGGTHYKINIRDLFRLIYHNQELDPSRIYKKPDAENYLTESELIRKTIFQLLIGKTFSEYYKVLADLKATEKERSIAKSVLDEFSLIIDNMNIGREELNATFLKEQLSEKIEQLNKLYQTRESLKTNRPLSSESSFSDVDEHKNQLASISTEIDEKENENRVKRTELIRFQRHRENIISEVTQIKKIIHTHESLSLFSMDTCPYCLREIDRKEHTCVCGEPINEDEYQRFFYTSEEYMDILKSKQKTVKTVDIAITTLEDEIKQLNGEISQLSEQYNAIKKLIRQKLLDVEAGLDIKKLDTIDDKILEVKSEMIAIERLLEQEEKRDKYQTRYDSLDRKFKELQLKEEELKARASRDMLDKIDAFNDIYNNLMTQTLKNCTTAKIDSINYMPVINNREYREASSSVSIRLMYYLTLLSLAMRNDDVKFPRLLLIDTPRTGGIDEHELDKALKKIPEELSDVERDKKYQIILTTGLQTYPESFETFVFQTLSDNNRLLVDKTLST